MRKPLGSRAGWNVAVRLRGWSANGRAVRRRFRRMGGAKRYPSIASGYLGDGFRCALPILRRRDFASRGALRPSLSISFTPFNQEGAGNAGRRLAPAVSCAMCTDKCAHEHTGTAGAARHSLRDGFTAYTELSPETNSFCLRRRRIEGFGETRLGSQNLRRLDASNGRQNHTALPSAITPFVGARPSLMSKLTLRRLVARPACRGHRSPHPTSVTIAIRPSCGRGMAGVVRVIWGEREAEYFSQPGWTGFR